MLEKGKERSRNSSNATMEAEKDKKQKTLKEFWWIGKRERGVYRKLIIL